MPQRQWKPAGMDGSHVHIFSPTKKCKYISKYIIPVFRNVGTSSSQLLVSLTNALCNFKVVYIHKAIHQNAKTFGEKLR